MKNNPDRAQLCAPLIALIGAAALCFATGALAESQALKKLGQIAVINQTLQPKPLKAKPAASANNYPDTSNATTPNASVSLNDNAAPSYNWNAINASNAANAANAARVNAIPGAPPPAPKK